MALSPRRGRAREEIQEKTSTHCSAIKSRRKEEEKERKERKEMGKEKLNRGMKRCVPLSPVVGEDNVSCWGTFD